MTDDEAQTALQEWQWIVGTDSLAEALHAAHERVMTDKPYALHEHVEQLEARIAKLEDAFERVAASRNEWRARAKRAGVPGA